MVDNVWAKASSQGRLWLVRSERTTSSNGGTVWRISLASLGTTDGRESSQEYGSHFQLFAQELTLKETEKKVRFCLLSFY